MIRAVNGIRFRDRADAGRLLAERLRGFAGRDDVIVLGLSRGGVPVAYEVARALSAPVDVWVVRKVGVPGREELAMGALASGGGMVLDEALVRGLGISDAQIRRVVEREQVELRRQELAYIGERPPLRLEGRTVILVDDGLATGATMYAAVLAVRRRHPAAIVVAVPVAAGATVARLRQVVDDVVCCMVPEVFRAVGEWYEDFLPTSDTEVKTALLRAGF
jgi:predicted phosphoribosyltransferase